MNKVVIIGSAGAGKSTLARQLSNSLNIEVLHLDRFFWGPGWKEKSLEERIAIQHELMQRDRWIIEGTYLSSSDERLKAADTIIFLDIPVPTCLWRVIKRRVQDHNKTRPDLPEGCTEKLHWTYLLKVLVFPLRGRRLYFEKKAELEQTQNICFYRLTSRKRVVEFLHNVAGEQQAELPCDEAEQLQAQHITCKSPLVLTLVGAR